MLYTREKLLKLFRGHNFRIIDWRKEIKMSCISDKVFFFLRGMRFGITLLACTKRAASITQKYALWMKRKKRKEDNNVGQKYIPLRDAVDPFKLANGKYTPHASALSYIRQKQHRDCG